MGLRNIYYTHTYIYIYIYYTIMSVYIFVHHIIMHNTYIYRYVDVVCIYIYVHILYVHLVYDTNKQKSQTSFLQLHPLNNSNICKKKKGTHDSDLASTVARALFSINSWSLLIWSHGTYIWNYDPSIFVLSCLGEKVSEISILDDLPHLLESFEKGHRSCTM